MLLELYCYKVVMIDLFLWASQCFQSSRNVLNKSQDALSHSRACVYKSGEINAAWLRLQQNLCLLVSFLEMENIQGQKHQKRSLKQPLTDICVWANLHLNVLCTQELRVVIPITQILKMSSLPCPNMLHTFVTVGSNVIGTCVKATCANCWTNLFLITAF